ncbi:MULTISPECIES: hypothetical protein [Streptomyces]|uniref:Uncharacterized protein n=1 Tax=Streptomyces venezuelae TaxID=54571 RepID=A0A5P2AVJ4_STRVZ|nr:hypothetical protein [Streptomyces venezuelae]QES20219.1 hypothetical protein DEJ46_14790 [Streptomyces venezuelae]
MTAGAVRSGVALASAALAVTAGLVGAAPSAEAAACTVWKSSGAPWTGYAKCTNIHELRQYRVQVTCQGPTGGPFTRYGQWARNGGVSAQRCSDSPNVGVTTVRVHFRPMI